MVRLTLCCALVFCLAGAAQAFDEPTAKARVAEECVACAAYYDIIANCLEATRPLDKDLAARYRAIRQKLTQQAEELNGRPETQAVDDAEAAMVREVHQDCNALAPLKDRYKEICKTLVEKPKSRLSHWLEQP
jgi:hypothetical protein